MASNQKGKITMADIMIDNWVDECVGDFVSDFTRPVRLLARLRDMLGDDADLLHDLAGADDAGYTNVIDHAVRTLLDGSDRRIADVAALDDEHFVLVDDLGIAGTDDGIARIRLAHGGVIVAATTRLADTTRDSDSADMTEVDIACALSMLMKSQVGNYVLLRYNQTAMVNNPIVLRDMTDAFATYGGLPTECRSVVIDLSDLSIVSLPYHKFRNMGECDGYEQEDVEARIDHAKRVEFSEKLDGSMVQIAWVGDRADNPFDDGLLVSSSGSLTSEHMMNARRWMITHESERFADMARDNVGKTLIIEYVNPPVDPHVVAYPMERWDMYLTGIRDVATGRLAPHRVVEEMAVRYGVRCTHLFADYDMDKVLDVCHNEVPENMEGFVLNVDGFLVKLKLDTFLGIAKVVHQTSSHNVIIRNVAYGLMDDLIALVPSPYRANVMETARRYERYDERMRATVSRLADAAMAAGSDQRDVARYVNEHVPRFARGYVFAVTNGKGLPKSFLGNYLYTQSPHFMSMAEFEDSERKLAEWERTLS